MWLIFNPMKLKAGFLSDLVGLSGSKKSMDLYNIYISLVIAAATADDSMFPYIFM